MTDAPVVSWSEISAFRTCELRHDLAYRQRWTKPTDSEPLTKGTMFHEAMDAYYTALRARADWKDATGLAMDAIAPNAEVAGLEQVFDDVMWMLTGYTEHYRDEPELEVLAVEHRLEVPLIPPTGPFPGVRLKAKIDLIVRQRATGRVYIVDHKTGKALPGGKDFDFDDQFGLYTWALARAGKPVFGTCRNAVKTYRTKKEQAADQRFRRLWNAKTTTELTGIAKDAQATVARMYPEASGYDRIGGGQPLRQPSPDHCSWCDYREVCLADRRGIDPVEFLKAAGWRQNFERH